MPESCKPETAFVVVVEVDNVRAEAAFRKAIEDAAEFWPQLEVVCERNDRENEERDKAADQERQDALRLEFKSYFDALDNYEKNKGSMFRAPKKPEEPTRLQYRRLYGSRYWPGKYRSINHHETDLSRIKRLWGVASVAIAPYRMTEMDALEMASCDRGERWYHLRKWLSEKG